MSLPRSLSDSLGLSAAEEESILKDIAILARVKTAESRGMVIIEIDREVFERFAGGEVEWTTDEMGWSAPRLKGVSRAKTDALEQREDGTGG